MGSDTESGENMDAMWGGGCIKARLGRVRRDERLKQGYIFDDALHGGLTFIGCSYQEGVGGCPFILIYDTYYYCYNTRYEDVGRPCVCMHACMCVCMCVCMYGCLYACMYVRMYVCMYVCMCVCMVCMYVCMHACAYVCMDVCVCVWMYVYVYVCVCVDMVMV